MGNAVSNRKEFQEVLKSTKRKGTEQFLEWLNTTDFYTAPASTRFHGAYEGGLLDHTLNVYRESVRIYASNLFTTLEIPMNSVILCSLLHDVCKIHCYRTELRWTKQDNKWVQIPKYVWDEREPFGGHGSKSVYIAQRFFDLNPQEAAAINAHMGAYDNPNVNKVYEANKLAWLIHIADEYASMYVDGCEKVGENSE